VSEWQSELQSGKRFGFGDNWARFLARLDETRIAEAVRSLQKGLQRESLAGLRFLDAGSGSGLFSLAARRLGATVVSFDYDPQSVACTVELRRRYFDADPNWLVQQGSVLDQDFLSNLGAFDVVYSWGVLHHTGDMWTALDRVSGLVRPGGQLYIAIYNDQGKISRMWLQVKRLYQKLPGPVRPLYVGLVASPREILSLALALVQLKPGSWVRRWTQYQSARGMSRWHDYVDWTGGLPFEVASPEAIVTFYRQRGFKVDWLRTVGGRLGCNEFVFLRNLDGEAAQPRTGTE